jgi:Holliday junction resolvasome RuvABC endonuclease subunit
MKVLSLDVSSKTGFCFFETTDKMTLLDYGQIPKIECPDKDFPESFVLWANEVFKTVEELIKKHRPDRLVIEQTCAGSKNAMSQKLLEFVHFLLADYIVKNKIPCSYIMTGIWRKEVGSYMSAEEKKQNKKVKEYKKKHKTNVAKDENGKRIGLIGKKHVTIRLVNEVFKDQLKEPLKRKDEDTADAIAIALCFHKQKLKSCGNVE